MEVVEEEAQAVMYPWDSMVEATLILNDLKILM
jgi:hypothetical protein